MEIKSNHLNKLNVQSFKNKMWKSIINLWKLLNLLINASSRSSVENITIWELHLKLSSKFVSIFVYNKEI